MRRDVPAGAHRGSRCQLPSTGRVELRALAAGRPIGMAASRHLPATSHANGLRATPGAPGRRHAALGACALLGLDCSGGPATASSASSAGAGRRHGVACMGPAAAPEAGPDGARGAAKQAYLTALLPARQAIIYTASLTVRAGDVRAAAGAGGPAGLPGYTATCPARPPGSTTVIRPTA